MFPFLILEQWDVYKVDLLIFILEKKKIFFFFFFFQKKIILYFINVCNFLCFNQKKKKKRFKGRHMI
jgi:hypothetical protein